MKPIDESHWWFIITPLKVTVLYTGAACLCGSVGLAAEARVSVKQLRRTKSSINLNQWETLLHVKWRNTVDVQQLMQESSS